MYVIHMCATLVLQEIAESWDYSFRKNFDVLADRYICRVKDAMYREYMARSDNLAKLHLVVGPGTTRGVVAADHILKGKPLEIMAATPTVCITSGVEGENDVPPSCVSLGPAFSHPATGLECYAYMVPKITKPEKPTESTGHAQKKRSNRGDVCSFLVFAASAGRRRGECDYDLYRFHG